MYPKTQWKATTIRLLIFVVSVLLAEPRGSGKHLGAIFRAASDRGLVYSDYARRKTASSVICVRDCHSDTRCHSVNYCPHSQTCVLNDADQAQKPGDFKQMLGFVYYDGSDLLAVPDAVTCRTLFEAGERASGVYNLTVAQRNFQAYCDMTTDGGGWVTIQRRQDGSVKFYRNWAAYRAGFGDLAGEFWLGNDMVRQLTELACGWELLVELEALNGTTAWAKYGEFRIEGDKYTLRVDAYFELSTAGNALEYHNGRPFTTYDQDNGASPYNCAVRYFGAWWYNWCYRANLNGLYYRIVWNNQQNVIQGEPLKKCSMKIRELK